MTSSIYACVIDAVLLRSGRRRRRATMGGERIRVVLKRVVAAIFGDILEGGISKDFAKFGWRRSSVIIAKCLRYLWKMIWKLDPYLYYAHL